MKSLFKKVDFFKWEVKVIVHSNYRFYEHNYQDSESSADEEN